MRHLEQEKKRMMLHKHDNSSIVFSPHQNKLHLNYMYACQSDASFSSAVRLLLVSQLYPHVPRDDLCLPVCCVWVSGSRPGASSHDSPVGVIKHTHAVISTAPSQNRLEAVWGSWTESQLACSVTVYTVTPFKICQPFKLLFAYVIVMTLLD